MKYIFIILLSFTVNFSIGQNLFINQLVLPLDTTKNSTIYHYSDVHFGSTHFKLALPLKFYNGGFITNANKGNLSQLEKLNISGGSIDLNAGGTIYKPNNKHIDGWYINMNWLQSAAIKYPQGLFNAIMDGNINIDNTIDLSEINGHLRNHHKFSLGVIKSKWQYGLTIGSINKEINMSLDNNSSVLFDNPYEWDIALNGEINSSQPSTNNFTSNGISFGTDIIYKNQSNEKWLYSIGLNNFGILILNKNNPTYSVDTSFVFSGLSIQEWRNIDSSIANYFSVLDTSYKSNVTTLTPFTLAGNLQLKVNNSLSIYSIVKYTHLSQGNYSVSVGSYKQINDEILIGSGLNYHGISTFQLEFFSYYNKGKLNLGIKLNNLFGIIPSLGKSFGLQTFISWKL